MFGFGSQFIRAALLGVLLVAAQLSVGGHFHPQDDTFLAEHSHHHEHAHHHEHGDHEEDELPSHECGVCIIASAISQGAGPLPGASDLPRQIAFERSRPLPVFTIHAQQAKIAGVSQRGPPKLPSCALAA